MTFEQESNPGKDESCWLIKSGDRIIGPFSREEIKRMLYAKEIVVIDEVTTPMRRWRYIRDEPTFAVVVEEIRKSNLGSREDTEVGTFTNTHATVTSTATATSTATLTPTDASDQTAKPSDHSVDMPAGVIKDAEVVSETKRSPLTRLMPPQANLKSYGYGQDRRVQNQINRSARIMWIITVVILLGAGFLFVRMQSMPRTENDGAKLFTLMNEAANARKAGDFKRTLEIYERLAAAGATDAEMMVDMAALRLKTRDFSVPPSRILDTIQAGNLISAQPETRAKLETVRGLTYLIDAERDPAAAQFKKARAAFEEALKHDPSFVPAIFNKAMTDYLDPAFDFSDAQNTKELSSVFDSVHSSSLADPSAEHASKLMAQMVFLKTKDPFFASQVARALERYKKTIVQFWQEASLLRLYALYLSRNIPAAQVDLRLMLAGDPMVTAEHYTDPLIYVQPLQWSGLLPICEDLHRGISVPSQISKKVPHETEALVHFCRYQAGERRETARSKILELEKKHITDPLIRSLAAYMVMSLNPDQAKAKVVEADDSQDWDLGRVLRGRLCRRDDFKCLHEGFQKTTTVTPPAIFFRVAAARYFFAQSSDALRDGDPARAEAQAKAAQEYLDVASRISPNYIPLILFSNETQRKR